LSPFATERPLAYPENRQATPISDPARNRGDGFARAFINDGRDVGTADAGRGSYINRTGSRCMNKQQIIAVFFVLLMVMWLVAAAATVL
jgi:hypothetical protein